MKHRFLVLILRGQGELCYFMEYKERFFNSALFHLRSIRNIKFSFACLAYCPFQVCEFLIPVIGELSIKAAFSFLNLTKCFPVQVSLPASIFFKFSVFRGSNQRDKT